MSKKLGFVVALLGLCASSLLLVSCGSSSSRPAGLLYVLTEGTTFNSSLGNSVSSFAINLYNGNLTLINSNASTCPTQTASCGLPINIFLDPTNSVGFVLNQGIPTTPVAPSIYSYTVNSDGSLSVSATAAPSWNCIAPLPASCDSTNSYSDLAIAMVRDTNGQFIFVIDNGTSPSPATCPVLATAVSNSTQATQFAGCPSISVFAMKPGSTTLTLVSQSATYQSPLFVSRIPTALSAVNYTPPGGGTPQEFLYVTYNQDLVFDNDNTLSAYSVSSSGILTDLTPNQPYVTAADPISVLAVNTNPSGRAVGGLFVFVGNQGATTGAITGYQVCTVVNAVCLAENLSQLEQVPGPPASAGENPVAMVVDPTNTFLYTVSELSNQVFGYRISTSSGTLSSTVPAYQPTGTQPVALALQPTVNLGGANSFSGQYLFVSNTNSSNLTGFTVSTTSGSMSNPTSVISPPGPTGMAAK
ncbi:MAG: beta-propeller fold lactonase family protein [Terriglobales bacterium]|jgi:lactonase family protein with 7-bladed beta-propeller